MDIFKKFTARAVKLVSGRASVALFCDYAYANEMKTPVHPGYGRGKEKPRRPRNGICGGRS